MNLALCLLWTSAPREKTCLEFSIWKNNIPVHGSEDVKIIHPRYGDIYHISMDNPKHSLFGHGHGSLGSDLA